MIRDLSGASVVVGQRRCLHCRYSLTGQPITREEAYGIYVARCPECGRLAPLSEHAVTGGFTRLWTFLLGLSWSIIVLAVLGLGSRGLFGLCMASSLAAAEDYRDEIRILFGQSTQAKNAPAASGTTTFVVNGRAVTVPNTGPGTAFQDWWALQDQDALLAAKGGRWGALFKPAFLIWIPLILGAVTFGAFWGVVHFRRRRAGHLVWVATVTAVILLYAAPVMYEWTNAEVTWTNEAAMAALGVPMMVLSILVVVVSLIAGGLLGRPLARLGAKLTLPPRLRTGLAMLWLTDGLSPPVTVPRDAAGGAAPGSGSC